MLSIDMSVGEDIRMTDGWEHTVGTTADCLFIEKNPNECKLYVPHRVSPVVNLAIKCYYALGLTSHRL